MTATHDVLIQMQQKLRDKEHVAMSDFDTIIARLTVAKKRMQLEVPFSPISLNRRSRTSSVQTIEVQEKESPDLQQEQGTVQSPVPSNVGFLDACCVAKTDGLSPSASSVVERYPRRSRGVREGESHDHVALGSATLIPDAF